MVYNPSIHPSNQSIGKHRRGGEEGISYSRPPPNATPKQRDKPIHSFVSLVNRFKPPSHSPPPPLLSTKKMPAPPTPLHPKLPPVSPPLVPEPQNHAPSPRALHDARDRGPLFQKTGHGIPVRAASTRPARLEVQGGQRSRAQGGEAGEFGGDEGAGGGGGDGGVEEGLDVGGGDVEGWAEGGEVLGEDGEGFGGCDWAGVVG